MQRMMIEKARAYLAEGRVDRVLGWAEGVEPWERVPAVFTAENIDGLRYDGFCGANLSKYLIAETEKPGRILAFLKPCDTRSFNQLCTDHRVDPDKVYVVGIGCRGKIDVEKLRKSGIHGLLRIDEAGDRLLVKSLDGEHSVSRRDTLLLKCLSCGGKDHKAGAEFLGESEDTTYLDAFAEIDRLEAMSAEKRFDFWRAQLSKCIRCNACRNVCPACSCVRCIFDNPESGVENKASSDDFEENLFHVIRAFHVAGRCTDCGECTRVCPQGIPLHLLNRKLIRDIDTLYGEYRAGDTIGQRHPLISYDKSDADPADTLKKGGARP